MHEDANEILGSYVSDPVTGIKGVAYCRTVYLQGCARVGIQEKAYKNKDGETVVPELYFVDEPQLVIHKNREKIVSNNISRETGGPSSRMAGICRNGRGKL